MAALGTRVVDVLELTGEQRQNGREEEADGAEQGQDCEERVFAEHGRKKRKRDMCYKCTI